MQNTPKADYEFCQVNRDGHLLIVTINRPDRMNALHPPANDELEQVFNDFATDPDLWVAILTAAGDRAFCTGNDLKYQAGGGKLWMPKTGFAGLTSRFDLNKPVIAAVNGYALGGGFEIALACDLIVASESAAFSLPEPKVGLAALAGGVHRLVRQIGQKQAMELLLTGRRISAAQALEKGIINQVVSAGELLTAARALAAEILQCSPLSIRATKEMVQQGLDKDTLENAVTSHYPAVKTLFKSADFFEGPMAFAEKRAPQWQGK